MDYVTSISILTLIFIPMLIIIHLGNTMIYLLEEICKNKSTQIQFFHRIVDSWNLLPYDTHKAVNVNIFKRGVKKFLSDNTFNQFSIVELLIFISIFFAVFL